MSINIWKFHKLSIGYHIFQNRVGILKFISWNNPEENNNSQNSTRNKFLMA